MVIVATGGQHGLFSYVESSVPIEVVNFRVVHTGHFIVWLRRHKRDK